MIDTTVKKVVYVGGWNSGRSDFTQIETILRRIYPNATLERFEWKSDVAWRDALQNAERATQNLREYLETESPETLRSLALVGHSLGARIAVGALRDGATKLRRIVLLGAAIDCDSPDVACAARRSEQPLANVYSPFDVALTFYGIEQGVVALGQRGAVGANVLNVPALNGSLSQAAALLLVPLAFPARILAALVNAALQSHSFRDYLKAWRDFDPNVRRAVVEPENWRAEVPNDVAEATTAALTRWLTKRTGGTLVEETDDAFARLDDERLRASLDGVRKISAVVTQLGPNDFAWNCVVESFDASGTPTRTFLNLNVDRSREVLPSQIRAEFLKTNCSSYELIIFKQKEVENVG